MDIKTKIINQSKKRANILNGGTVLLLIAVGVAFSVRIFQMIGKYTEWGWEERLPGEYQLMGKIWLMLIITILVLTLVAQRLPRNLAKILNQLSDSDLKRYETIYDKLSSSEKMHPGFIPSSKKIFITIGVPARTIEIPYSEIQEIAVNGRVLRAVDSYWLDIKRKNGKCIKNIQCPGPSLYPIWKIYQEEKPWSYLYLPSGLIERFEKYDVSEDNKDN